MDDIETLITGLKKLRTEHACSSVATPRDKTGFEFGRICGYDEGIGAALDLLDKILEENPDENSRSAFGKPLITSRG